LWEKPTRPDNISRRFVLEAIDAITECPTSEIGFDVDDTAELFRMIGANAAELDLGGEYELEAHDVGRLIARYNIAFEPGTRAVRLRCWLPIDDLPYKVHTGRELALMLEGNKPLAYFSGQYPSNPDVEEIPERLFDPYVAALRFKKREWVTSALGGIARIVMYSLPDQEWRIDAMILLLETASKSGWSDGFERMQGALLGYEDWQNDIFIERIYRSACATGKS
jgi:hypothetical protein